MSLLLLSLPQKHCGSRGGHRCAGMRSCEAAEGLQPLLAILGVRLLVILPEDILIVARLQNRLHSAIFLHPSCCFRD